MFEKFNQITGYDIESFFRRFSDFIDNKSQNIIDFYSGLVDELDRESFGEYEILLKESSKVIDLFSLNQERFQTVDYWQLLEFADDIRIKLETIGKFNKYARTSVKRSSYDNDVVFKVATRDNETIEELVGRLGSTDRNGDWIEVALDNRLEQEGYTRDGGVVLEVTFKNSPRFFIESIVDAPLGDRIKGMDIDRQIQFIDNDLKVLDYDNTLAQTLDILIGLKKNDNPEFPQYGVDPSLVIGMNIKSAGIPSILRQLFQTFATDDLIKTIRVIKTDFNSDNIGMDLEIAVKSGEQQQKSLSLGN